MKKKKLKRKEKYMVTQLLKWKKQVYNGNNHFNNNVTIDFAKNTVDFEPAENWGLVNSYFIFLIPHIGIVYRLISMYIYFAMICIVGFAVGSKYAWLPIASAFAKAFGIFSIILLFSLFILSLMFFVKEWRMNYFPKYNVMILNIASIWTRKKKLIITINY